MRRLRPSGRRASYHTAILYPSRHDLALALRRLIEAGYPFSGAAAMGFRRRSISTPPTETALSGPREQWPRHPDGSLNIYTIAFDLDALLREAEENA